jgi:lysyl-tRNA synthetase class 1
MESHDPFLNHWADQAAAKTLAAHPGSGRITVAAGITPSGVVHVGNFREVMTVDLVARALRDRGADVRFIYSWDDFDVFRKVPQGRAQQDMLKDNLGRSIADVPGSVRQDRQLRVAPHRPVRGEPRAARHRPGVHPPVASLPRRRLRRGHPQGAEHTAKIREISNRARGEATAASLVGRLAAARTGFCDACGRDKLDFGWDGRLDRRRALPQLQARRRRRPAQGRQFQAAVARRLADALGPRGRLLRARRQGPQHRRRQLRHREGHRGRGLRLEPRPSTSATTSCASRAGRQDLEQQGRRGDRRRLFRDLRARGAALDLRQSYARTPSSRSRFDLDVIKLYEDYDRLHRVAYGLDEAKDESRRLAAQRALQLASVDHRRIHNGDKQPFVPGFRHLSTILQIHEGDLDGTVQHYVAAGLVTDDRERAHCRERARCVRNWLKDFAPEEFRYTIRGAAKVRPLSADEATCLTRLTTILRERPDVDEDGLVPTMKSLCEGTALDNKAFLPVVYDLLIDRDKGPKLTTLVTTMGTQRALALLTPSLDALAFHS